MDKFKGERYFHPGARLLIAHLSFEFREEILRTRVQGETVEKDAFGSLVLPRASPLYSVLFGGLKFKAAERLMAGRGNRRHVQAVVRSWKG